MSTVFVDIDTQVDFLYPAGALYVPGAEKRVGAIAKLNRFAAAQGFPVISTMDAHAENDSEFASWPPHCILGTLGQRKPEETLLERRVVVRNQPGEFSLEGARQIVIEKQTVNVFDTVTMERILEQLAADRFVVYGVVTEVCVLCAVRGLVKTGKPVAVVTDAIETLNASDSVRALGEMQGLGAGLTMTGAVCV